MARVGLPHDIIEDILSRLPIKSLTRLRCISKSCNLLISMDQSFARMHAKRALQSSKSSTSQKILLASTTPRDLRSLDLDYEEKGNYSFGDEGAISRLVFPAETPDDLPLRVGGSCHGLLLVAFENGKDFYLWNPATGDYKKLPDPCILPESDTLPRAYDRELRYSFVYGFGYDSSSDDYKVLLGLRIWWVWPWNPDVECYNDEHEVKFAIFSVRENCWRNIQQELYRCNGGIPDHPRRDWEIANLDLVNGTLNWLVLTTSILRDCVVVAFDLKTERFLELPMPDEIDLVLFCDCEHCDYGQKIDEDGYALFAGLGVVGGRLCLCVGGSSPQYPIELWVMNEGQSWTRLLDSPFQNKLQGSAHEQRICQYPLCISKDNQIILVDDLFRLTRFDAGETRKTEHTSWLCRCETHCFPKIENPNTIPGYYRCKAVSYLETLVSPNFK